MTAPRNTPSTPLPNEKLMLAYLLPYAAYVGLATFQGSLFSRELAYALRILCCGALLLYFWRRYVSLGGPRSRAGSLLLGAIVGLFGSWLWLALRQPFAPAAAEPWTPTAFALRMLASVALAPLIEELLLRGYLLRLVVQWQRARRAGEARPLQRVLDARSIDEVEPGAWTPLAVLLSTAAFTLGHAPAEWPAAGAYGLLMAMLWIARRDLLSCVVAHAVTNLGLGLWVWNSGHFELW